MTWVEVAKDGTTRRWDYAPGPPGTLPMSGGRTETCPTLELRHGDMLRVALLSSEVAGDDTRVRSVAANMAAWDDESQYIPAVRLYVWGSVWFTGGTTRQGLCLIVVDLEGTVSAMLPIELLGIS